MGSSPHEGVARRKFWRDGRWFDADLYAILEEDWYAMGIEGRTGTQLQGCPPAALT
jgi:hypothetical protein